MCEREGKERFLAGGIDEQRRCSKKEKVKREVKKVLKSGWSPIVE